ncbi:MAG TPA: hypothetical protein VGC01_00020 [Mucilaginibacter sp.]
MKSLQFNFRHPVKGQVKLFNQFYPKQTRMLLLDIEAEEVIIIPVEGLCAGKWKAMLEWEHDDRNYFYEQEFEIT